MNGATRRVGAAQSNDRWIAVTAIVWFPCGYCSAPEGQPCRSDRGQSYAKWYVHHLRRTVLDEAFMRGFRTGQRRARARDDKGRAAA